MHHLSCYSILFACSLPRSAGGLSVALTCPKSSHSSHGGATLLQSIMQFGSRRAEEGENRVVVWARAHSAGTGHLEQSVIFLIPVCGIEMPAVNQCAYQMDWWRLKADLWCANRQQTLHDLRGKGELLHFGPLCNWELLIWHGDWSQRCFPKPCAEVPWGRGRLT